MGDNLSTFHPWYNIVPRSPPPPGNPSPDVNFYPGQLILCCACARKRKLSAIIGKDGDIRPPEDARCDDCGAGDDKQMRLL